MGKICTNAAVVSVWLGDILRDDVSPAEVLHERRVRNVPGVHNRRLVPSLASFTFDHPLATLDEDDLSQDLAHSIHDMARERYWKRAWIIQEFLLARKIHIYYGDARIDEADFRAVPLEQLNLKCDTKSFTATSNNLLNDRRLLEEWPPLIFVTERQQKKKRAQMKRPFYDLLAAHGDAECSVEEDIVFSLLSLIKPEERTMLGRCFPDYALDFKDVALVALAHLKHFSGDKPLQPLIRALIHEQRLLPDDIRLLFHLIRSFDYAGCANPAAEAYKLRRENTLASGHVKQLDIDDYLHKLEQPNMTVNGLYDDAVRPKASRYLASGISSLMRSLMP